MSLDRLLDALVEEGLISAEAIPSILANVEPDKPDATRAWYVRFLMGFSAWVAAGLFVAALGIFGLLDEPFFTVLVGLIMIVLALMLRIRTPLRSQSEQIFRTQLALAGSVTGQLLVLFGVADAFDETAAALAVLIPSCLLFWRYPDRLHRFLSALAAIAALASLCAIHEFELGYQLLVGLLLGTAIWLWWRAERRWLGSLASEYALPLCYAVPLALLVLLLALAMSELANPALTWLSAVFAIAGAFFVAWQILGSLALASFGRNPKLTPLLMALILIVGLITATQPGFLISLTLLALAFWRSDRVLQVLSSMAAVFFISNYYYRLDMTLLNKSFVLMATGVILLAAWAFLRRETPQAAIATQEIV